MRETLLQLRAAAAEIVVGLDALSAETDRTKVASDLRELLAALGEATNTVRALIHELEPPAVAA